MTKIYHNGVARDMTPEEIEYFSKQEEAAPPKPEPSIEDQLRERIAALEAALLDI